MHKSYMKNALSWGKHCFLPLFDNVIRNDITNSITHIIVCVSPRIPLVEILMITDQGY